MKSMVVVVVLGPICPIGQRCSLGEKCWEMTLNQLQFKKEEKKDFLDDIPVDLPQGCWPLTASAAPWTPTWVFHHDCQCCPLDPHMGVSP